MEVRVGVWDGEGPGPRRHRRPSRSRKTRRERGTGKEGRVGWETDVPDSNSSLRTEDVKRRGTVEGGMEHGP